MSGVLRVPLSGQLAICINLYLHHRKTIDGRCGGCGGPAEDCPSRRNSARVIEAAGLDPARLDHPGGRRAAVLLLRRVRGERPRLVATVRPPLVCVPRGAEERRAAWELHLRWGLL